MRIYLFRHADKERSPSNNPPLSRQGLAQSRSLVQLVRTGILQKPETLVSSPKSRAVQTLTPLAEEYKISLKENPSLDERNCNESPQAFLQRVKATLLRFEQNTGVTYAVTHYDWIEAALLSIASDTDLSAAQYQGWAPAQHMEFEVNDGLWQLQSFKGVPV